MGVTVGVGAGGREGIWDGGWVGIGVIVGVDVGGKEGTWDWDGGKVSDVDPGSSPPPSPFSDRKSVV